MRSLIAILLLSTPALADNCCGVRVQSSHVPVAVKTVAVPSATNVYILQSPVSIPQGSTTYTAQAYPDLSLIDVNRIIAQAFALEQAAQASRTTSRAEILEFTKKLVEIQRPIAEQIARGQAAAEVLKQAGLVGQSGAADIDAAAAPSLAQQLCGKCHTGDAAKAGFRLDQSFDAALAIRQIASGKMPPEGGLPHDQRSSLILELLSSQEE